MTELPRIATTRELAEACGMAVDPPEPLQPITVTTTEEPTKPCECGKWPSWSCRCSPTLLAPGDEAEVGWWEKYDPTRNTGGWFSQFHRTVVGTVVEVKVHWNHWPEEAVSGHEAYAYQEWSITLTNLKPMES